MRPAALLFDLDGTLLDTLEDLGGAMNRVLVAQGLPAHPVDAYRAFVGDGIARMAERALPPGCRTSSTVATTVEAMRLEYARSWAGQTHAYAGIPELFDALTARRLPLAVLSNKPHDFTVAMVAHFLGRWPFRAVEGCRAGRPPKPDPTAALAIAGQVGAEPAACLFVGDSAVDVLTARGAGMVSVGVGWGFRGEAELCAAGAAHMIHAPLELLRLVDGSDYNLGSKANG